MEKNVEKNVFSGRLPRRALEALDARHPELGMLFGKHDDFARIEVGLPGEVPEPYDTWEEYAAFGAFDERGELLWAADEALPVRPALLAPADAPAPQVLTAAFHDKDRDLVRVVWFSSEEKAQELAAALREALAAAEEWGPVV